VAIWTEKEILLRDLNQLYQDLAGEWLLLEILPDFPSNDTTKKVEVEKKLPKKFRLHAHSHDKEKLHEFMMEHEDWDWSRKFLFVQADPEKPCEIGS
jgi:phosphorylcholine metabolism protein LicD